MKAVKEYSDLVAVLSGFPDCERVVITILRVELCFAPDTKNLDRKKNVQYLYNTLHFRSISEFCFFCSRTATLRFVRKDTALIKFRSITAPLRC